MPCKQPHFTHFTQSPPISLWMIPAFLPWGHHRRSFLTWHQEAYPVWWHWGIKPWEEFNKFYRQEALHPRRKVSGREKVDHIPTELQSECMWVQPGTLSQPHLKKCPYGQSDALPYQTLLLCLLICLTSEMKFVSCGKTRTSIPVISANKGASKFCEKMELKDKLILFKNFKITCSFFFIMWIFQQYFEQP